MKNLIFCISESTKLSTLVEIECHPGKGLPITTIIGLAGRSVAESKDRIRAAFQASDIPYPRRRLTINLAPANVPKQSAGFDLGIATSILLKAKLIKPKAVPAKACYLGELGLDGTVKALPGIIGRIAAAQSQGIDTFFIPASNMGQAQLIPGITLIGIGNLRQLYEGFHGLTDIAALPTGNGAHVASSPSRHKDIFEGISGQHHAKRAVAIAAAGGHNLLLNGRPGSGKTLLAKSLVHLLPAMDRQQLMAVTDRASRSGSVDAVVTARPVVMPHHTASAASLVGSSHHYGALHDAGSGVLILDELPEFSRSSIEALRGPLDAAHIGLDVQFVATANPCPCGFQGHPTRQCRCSGYNISRYREKLSGPIIDRIDIFCPVEDIDHTALLTDINPAPPSGLRRSVSIARKAQAARYGDDRTLNATCSDKLLKQTCSLTPSAKNLLDTAAQRFDISARSYMRSLRIARTLADMKKSPDIDTEHIAEALRFRQPAMEPA